MTQRYSYVSHSMQMPLVLLLALFIIGAESYVTFKTYIPPTRQRQWLNQLTHDICDSPIGSRLIDSAPDVLSGWSMSKDVNVENALQVEALFKRLVEESKAGMRNVNPTTLDYNIILNMWVKSKGGVLAAERCEQILGTMQSLFHETNDFSIQPNVETFKSVLLSWKNSNVPFAAVRAQRVLEWMVRLYEAGENDALPDSDCFDIVLQIWSRTDDAQAAQKAEHLLLLQDKLSQITQSHKLKPTTTSFNAVLNAWAKKISKESPQSKKLVTLLSLMEHLYFEMGQTRVVPDRCSYNIVLCALAKGCCVQTAKKADTILRNIEDRYRRQQITWEPDAVLFNAAIGAWAHSDAPGAYRKAQSILDRQLNLFRDGKCLECLPDVIGFTSVLASCASEPKKSEQRKAFNVALSVIQTLEKHPEFGQANHVTYGTVLKACARLLPPGSAERIKWTRHFFTRACDTGMVGGMVLGRLREACSSQEEYRTLLQGHAKNDLPPEWTCNVQEKSTFRQQQLQKAAWNAKSLLSQK